MRFQLFIALVFFLIPYFSQGRRPHSNSDKQKGKNRNMEGYLIKLYKPVEDMVRSGLFVWDRRSNPKSMQMSLPSSIRGDMSERCPESLENLDKKIGNYNRLQNDYNSKSVAELGGGGVTLFLKNFNKLLRV